MIYLAKWNGIKVAVKQLHDDKLTSSDLKEFYAEEEVAYNLRFKHVVQLYGITQSGGIEFN